MKSSFCIDLQRFMLIPTKFPLSLKNANMRRNTKKEDFTEVKSSLESCFVIRMGLEPMTPTLKVLCSTS